jgi:hypothetical protein
VSALGVASALPAGNMRRNASRRSTTMVALTNPVFLGR